jgi:hypothetical protein
MEFEERRKKERKEEGKEGNELQATPHATNAESMEHLPIRIFPLKEEAERSILYTFHLWLPISNQLLPNAKCCQLDLCH